MIYQVVAVGHNGEYISGIPYVYTNNQWIRVNPKVYTNGVWQQVGGAGLLFTYFIDKDNKNFLSKTETNFLTKDI